MNKFFIITIFLGLLSGCASMPDTQSDEAAIRAHAEVWLEHYLGGNIDGLMRLYEPDAVVALHDQPALRGVDQIRSFFAPGMGKSDVTFELEFEHIEVSGDLAWIVSKYWLRAITKDSGELYEDAGRSLLVYRRGQDGLWRIAADIDNNTPDVSMQDMPSG